MAASARAQLAGTCQPGSSDPILLSRAKKKGVGRQEEVAQRKPFERVFSGLFRKQKGRGPFEIPGVPNLQCLPSRAPHTYFGRTLFLACKHLLVYKMTNDLPAEQQIWQSRPPQGIFALQKSLRVGCDGGGGLIAEKAVPAQRNFQRKFALRRVGSAKFVVPPAIEHSKVRRHARLVQPAVPGRPGVPEGPRPSVSEGVQRKPFPRVSSGQFLRGGSTRRFFAQLRSVGSNHPAGRSLPV